MDTKVLTVVGFFFSFPPFLNKGMLPFCPTPLTSPQALPIHGPACKPATDIAF